MDASVFGDSVTVILDAYVQVTFGRGTDDGVAVETGRVRKAPRV